MFFHPREMWDTLKRFEFDQILHSVIDLFRFFIEQSVITRDNNASYIYKLGLK